VPVHLERQRWQARARALALAVADGQLEQPAARGEVRVLEELLGLRDGRERQPGLFEFLHELLLGVPAEGLRDDRHESLFGGDAIAIGVEAAISREIGEPERLAQQLPLLVAHHAHEHLLAIGRVEHLVDGPRRHANRHRRGRLARHRILRHVLADEKHGALEELSLIHI